MVVCGEKSAGVEESVKKTVGSGSGEAAEGLVQLGKNIDEPVSSEQVTLADLLKRVTESYNPNKKGSSKTKTHGTARANKKRKAAPFVTIEIPPIRGRATRSQLKQNEAELQKALEDSRRKAVAKGKKKMDEPIEAVDIDEMDLVLRDKDETEEVEVLTPKAKKAKTSTKKSVSESKSAEPSTLEEEWSGEEEDDSDTEKDKMAKFGKRTILKGRLLRDLEEQGMVLLLEKLELQGWKDMVLQMDGKLDMNEIVEFMANGEVKDGMVTNIVKGVQVYFDVKELFYLEKIVIGTQSIQVRVNLKLSQQLEAVCHNGIIASMLHHETFLKYRDELSQLKAEVKELDEKRDMYKLLSEQREGEAKSLGAELEVAQKEHADLVEQVKIFKVSDDELDTMTNGQNPQIQQKINRIDQLRAEMDVIKVEAKEWKGKMDRLALENETAWAQLTSAEAQLRAMGEKFEARSQNVE
ncbi:uncharacterized protein [Nicotiana tomentosiformis]|uniref:uncharacterized protein n=1 Tax=Nicotiana tomentosiformis TaxID=4098 RepID=UPI00388C8D97